MNSDRETEARVWPAVPLEAWRELALRELRGAPLERLTTQTAEGLRIEALSSAEPRALPGRALLLAHAGWTITTEYSEPDAATAGAAIAEDLGRGARRCGCASMSAARPG